MSILYSGNNICEDFKWEMRFYKGVVLKKVLVGDKGKSCEVVCDEIYESRLIFVNIFVILDFILKIMGSFLRILVG